MNSHAIRAPGVAARASVRPIGSHPGRTVREGRVPGVLRRLATGAAAAAMLHAAVLGVSSRGEPYPELAWVGATQTLTSLYVLVPWPLTALILLWLARRQPALYARAALALLLTGAAGLAHCCWTGLDDLPAHEGSLFRDYVALPGALTGWYLLTALAMAAAVSSTRVRILVGTAGTGAVAISVLPSADPVTAASFAAAVPLLAWFLASRLPGQRAQRHRPADAWFPRREAVPLPHRAPAPAPRQAG
ncbi:hypothetical protein KBZ94_28150 [Streptomyces sp. RM72]|uniref:hypothetical protein n=1 Tax=unclassified Streptomyces TaxID=2593676 RepID=UPI000EF5F4E2|nr:MULTISPECIES: hypothetical protein [unclassified Streptomyces]MBQ0888741.1 hypothetical protein [Streptomyces sp. RM72]